MHENARVRKCDPAENDFPTPRLLDLKASVFCFDVLFGEPCAAQAQATLARRPQGHDFAILACIRGGAPFAFCVAGRVVSTPRVRDSTD